MMQCRFVMKSAAAAIAGLALSAVGTLSAVAQADLPEIRLTVTDLSPTGSTGDAAMTAYTKAVTEASGGKITFEIFFNSSLLPSAETAEGIASGTADMGPVLTPYNPADFPVSNWVAELGTLPKGGVPYSQLYGAAAQTEFVRTNEDYLREIHGRGLHAIGATFGQAFDMLCNKPVSNLAEAKGKRIRVGGQVWGLESQAIGMVPVPLVPSEIYEAFQRGIVDCLNIHPSVYLDFGLLDVPGQKYYLPIEFSGWNTNILAVNKAKWDAFPAEAKRIMTDAFPIYLAVQIKGNIDRHKAFAEATQGKGVELLNPDADIVEALAKHHAAALASLPGKAPPGVSDPAKLVADFTALIEKWRGIVDELGYAPVPVDIKERMATYSTQPDLEPFKDKLREEMSKMEM